jgi:hypothetical protein
MKGKCPKTTRHNTYPVSKTNPGRIIDGLTCLIGDFVLDLVKRFDKIGILGTGE